MSYEGVDSTVFMLGFVKGYARSAMNIQDITHHPQKHIIEYRVKLINFYDEFGPKATKAAFSVSRATIFNWKKKLKANQGRLSSLAPMPKAPLHRRSRSTAPVITNYIVKQRELHPRLGKAKLTEGLKPICRAAGISYPSVSTVGRVINDLKDQGRLPKGKRLTLDARNGQLRNYKFKPRIKKERRGDYYPSVPGDLVQLDCVIKFINGLRRYVISAIDYNSEFAFSMAYSSLSSARSKDFLDKFMVVAPFEVKRVQTDNGSEFYKLFHASCINLGLQHYWNYPRSPRMNAKIERYNRTIQEEFVDHHLEDMAYDLGSFNYQFMDWLLWYNTERPHWTLKLKSPLRALFDTLQLPVAESNMLWTDT